MPLQPVIGLETHVELSTATKMFCGCIAHGDDPTPNTHVCPVCMGHPGTLPVPNANALNYAILLGLALGGNIAKHSKFDRKHYFYPDLPKAYQISQFDLPVMTDGEVLIDLADGTTSRIGIERMHLEEDSAKNIHGAEGKTYVDFNRASVPLCEIVTKPDFTSAEQAKVYVQELRLLVRTLGISDGDLEHGHLRCDVNVSLREVDENGKPTGPLNPKTEIKNVNSFRAVERAIQYEIERQTKLWEAGTPPTATTTRGWSDATQSTVEQRTKEDSADYRYFPEPDIPPLDLEALTEEIKKRIPELPRAKRARFAAEYGFKNDDVQRIVDDSALANYTEALMSELGAWLQAQPDITPETLPTEQKKLTKLVTSWLLTKFPGILSSLGKSYANTAITPENFAEFLLRVARGQITMHKGVEVLTLMESEGQSLDDAVETLGAEAVDNKDELQALVQKALALCPEEVTRYKNGETKLLPFFLGKVMKLSQGNADPAATMAALHKELK